AMIQLRRGQLDQAADTAQRLVRMSPEIASRVAALSLLGRVEQKRGQLEAAAHAYEQAVAVAGMEGTAAKDFHDLVANRGGDDGPTFSRYLSALVRHAESTQKPTPPVFREIARTLADGLAQPDQALHWLERGLGVHGTDIDLRADFAERLLRAGQHQR